MSGNIHLDGHHEQEVWEKALHEAKAEAKSRWLPLLDDKSQGGPFVPEAGKMANGRSNLEKW